MWKANAQFLNVKSKLTQPRLQVHTIQIKTDAIALTDAADAVIVITSVAEGASP